MATVPYPSSKTFSKLHKMLAIDKKNAGRIGRHTEAAVPSKQVQALESFFDEFEQYVANAGRAVVAVTVAFVYVSQKVIAAAAEAVNTEAQASVSGLSHARMRRAAKAPRRRRDRLIILPSNS